MGAANRPLNQVRAIFIGGGAVGKTSLIRALHGEDVVEGDQKKTTGIAQKDTPSIHIDAAADVLEKQLEGTEITVHFWDFGGQVMTHATHQFFLRGKCLYVIVLDAGDERAIREGKNVNTEAEYWLEHVRAFGENAPVILVGSKCDLADVRLDLNTLHQKYPNIVGFFRVSSTEAKGERKAEFELFTRCWAENLHNIGMHEEMFTREQFAVMDAVKSRAEEDDFLRHEDYDKICTDANLPVHGPGGGESLRDLLDKLGIIMHFPQLARLDADILNPRWLTYGVYTLLFSEAAQKAHGQLSEAEAIAILSRAPVKTSDGRELSYTPARAGIILDAMEAFKVAYSHANGRDRQITIPSLLSENQPDHDFDSDGALAFQFDCKGLLPRHIIPTLIVDHHKDIKKFGPGAEPVVWRYGVLLKSEFGTKAEALIIADVRREQVLNIFVKGEDASDYLSIVAQNRAGFPEQDA